MPSNTPRDSKMKLLANTGNSLSLLVFIRSIKLISIYPYEYRIAFDTDLIESPNNIISYENTRLRFLATNPVCIDISITPIRIGVGVSDFTSYREAEDVYPKPKNHI